MMQLTYRDIHYSTQTSNSVPYEGFAQSVQLILDENRRVLNETVYAALEHLAQAITEANRIFVFGGGRSGLVMRMAAMRIMHLGCQVYVVGETITPAIEQGDLLITCSGSGNTGSVCAMAVTAKTIGAQLAVITANKTSPLAALADLTVELAAVTKHEREAARSQQFAGSLFEQSTLLLLDALFHVLSRTLNKSTQSLWAMHTNLE
ncbi:6-phospho-3-hexuloisomerase [Leptolyngbya sp. NK1-12]|nr:6-phospho-3-hexuloisomerase [Leptolyngbya sp. NK1-12]